MRLRAAADARAWVVLAFCSLRRSADAESASRLRGPAAAPGLAAPPLPSRNGRTIAGFSNFSCEEAPVRAGPLGDCAGPLCRGTWGWAAVWHGKFSRAAEARARVRLSSLRAAGVRACRRALACCRSVLRAVARFCVRAAGACGRACSGHACVLVARESRVRGGLSA